MHWVDKSTQQFRVPTHKSILINEDEEMKGSQESSIPSGSNNREIHARYNEKLVLASMNEEPMLGASPSGKTYFEETKSRREYHNSKCVK